MEQFRENENTSKQVLCLNNSQKRQNENQETTNDIIAVMEMARYVFSQ